MVITALCEGVGCGVSIYVRSAGAECTNSAPLVSISVRDGGGAVVFPACNLSGFGQKLILLPVLELGEDDRQLAVGSEGGVGVRIVSSIQSCSEVCWVRWSCWGDNSGGTSGSRDICGQGSKTIDVAGWCRLALGLVLGSALSAGWPRPGAISICGWRIFLEKTLAEAACCVPCLRARELLFPSLGHIGITRASQSWKSFKNGDDFLKVSSGS